MATTTNYSWSTPDDTDLVKDGAAAIRTLGSSIDTTTKALNPSTTLGDIEYRSATADTNTRLALGTAGQVLQVNSGATAPEWATPAGGSTYVGANVYKTATQSVSNGTWTNITYDAENFDTDAFHDNSTNNTRMTIPSGKNGKYLVTANITFAANADGVRACMIRKNGADYARGNFIVPFASADAGLIATATLDLVATDYIEIQVYKDGGGSLNLESGSIKNQFSISYLGA